MTLAIFMFLAYVPFLIFWIREGYRELNTVRNENDIRKPFPDYKHKDEELTN